MDNIKKDSLFGSISIFFIAAFITGVCAIASGSEPQKSFLDANAILQAWQRNYGSIKSMQVSYTERVLDAKPPTTDPNILDNLVMYQHVERVEEGKRYHIRFSKAEDGFINPMNLMEHAFDGSTTREYVAMDELGTIDPGLIGRAVETTNALKDYMLLRPIFGEPTQEFPDGIPIFSQILRSGISTSVATVRPNLELIAGQLCHVVEIMYKSHNFGYKIWVAHDKGMLPLKYQRWDNNKLSVEIEVEQIAKAETGGGDIWYPVKAYRTVNSKSRGTTVKYELTTHTFVPNVKVDDNTFRFDFPNGTSVVDKVKGIEYVVGAKDK
jgi:hypothetical protein